MTIQLFTPNQFLAIVSQLTKLEVTLCIRFDTEVNPAGGTP
jgi:hypothetical protein